MIVPAGSLFFVLAVFVNSIELSSLYGFWDLFPASLGEKLPHARILKYKDTYESWNIRKLVDKKVTKFDSHSILLARAQIIVGWVAKDTIEPLSDLSGRTDHVFDSKKKQFLKVDDSVRDALGVHSDWPTIKREDELVPICRPNAKSTECLISMQTVSIAGE